VPSKTLRTKPPRTKPTKSLLYLILAGSIIGFTAYVWLIHHQSPTKVVTYAYVNPVVAVLVGYFPGGEALGLRTILGTLFVLISFVVITMTPAKKPEATLPVEDAAEVGDRNLQARRAPAPPGSQEC
jgi:drug/metabolite transporter (DMT)-like permease